MAKEPATIMIVEDNFITAKYFSELLYHAGHRVCGCANTADEAVEMAIMHDPDAILMDVRLGGRSDGVEAGHRIASHVDVPIIYITGSQEPETMLRIRETHPSAILIKPIMPEQLLSALDSVLA